MKSLLSVLLLGVTLLFIQACSDSQAANDQVNSTTGEWYDMPVEFLKATSVDIEGNSIAYPDGQAQISSRYGIWEVGKTLELHKHNYPVIVSVFQGELTVNFEDGTSVVTPAGKGYVSGTGKWHSATSTGTEPLIVHAVYLGSDAMEHTEFKE